ncbi:hypothetical protein QMK19_03580 [Streptomyces sp. H10-C2]|uniref:hypothetical protein n=1 Tax=unclassified Streptomyces TaxID=2593676 RepID=UPI0024BA2F4C|nr:MULTISPECIES: hypothetical protein [unclassified Streptomyces]MDJ0342268.1 hypothetical protein [Streptomyces sp. PH10-H1]MDJ0368782.1 hypothetical protein [Streptomyces sp. H10-C2]
MPSTTITRPRSVRRAASRVEARRNAVYNGTAPRYEPARDLSCHQHYRQFPCKRCAGNTK